MPVRRRSMWKREPAFRPARRDLQEALRPWLPPDGERLPDVAQPWAAQRPEQVEQPEPVELPEAAEAPEPVEPPEPAEAPIPVERPHPAEETSNILALPDQPAVSPQEAPESAQQPQRPRGRHPETQPTPSKPPPVVGSERCRIGLWRGYVKSRLFAMPGVSGHPYADAAFAVSSYFRLPDPDEPTETAWEALQTLLDELEADDWTVVSKGRRWYELRLERPRS